MHHSSMNRWTGENEGVQEVQEKDWVEYLKKKKKKISTKTNSKSGLNAFN